MRYFYKDPNQEFVGPLTLAELRQDFAQGRLHPETPIQPEGQGQAYPLREVLSADAPGMEPPAEMQREDPPVPIPSPPTIHPSSRGELASHILVPLGDLRHLGRLDNRKLLSVSSIGLVPLMIIALMGDAKSVGAAYWAIAFYFSALWALFFYYVFSAPRLRLATSLVCFFGTGLLSVTLLFFAYKVPPLSWLMEWTRAKPFVWQFLGYTLAVGVPEELCKILILFVIWKKNDPLPPQSMLFYGLMSGLGFGIYEGVSYQRTSNFFIASGVGEYYLLNLLRLTSLPFLHATWSGIAAYFIGFGLRYPHRRLSFFAVAIALPAFLHGCYDAFDSPLTGFGFALFSVLLLNLYLAKATDIEMVLDRSIAGPPR